MLADRRTMLAGLAALPVAGLPLAAMAGTAGADPFTRYGAEILALHAAIDACDSDAASDPLMDRWGEIDAQAMAGRPTTLAGALGALEYARREVHQFHIVAVEAIGDDVCPGDRLVLHLIDGAIAVLRQGVGGGVA